MRPKQKRGQNKKRGQKIITVVHAITRRAGVVPEYTAA